MMNITIASRQLAHHFEQAQRVLLICHQQPDADAVGSVVALAEWLYTLGKPAVKFCQDPAPRFLDWLSNFEQFITDPKVMFDEHFDVVVVVDSSDLRYAGVDELLLRMNPNPTLINIDHHVTNQTFGDLNLVDKSAASTTEIIYRIFKQLGVTIRPKAASALLSGIIGDTYSFTNPNVTNSCLVVASGLMVAGASLPQVIDSLLKNKSIDNLKLWGTALARLQYNDRLGVAVTTLTAEDLRTFGGDLEATAGISNFLNNLSGVKASLVLVQDGAYVKGSLRTNDELMDVSELATLLGGGGHKKAAGFKIKGRLTRDGKTGWQIV